MPQFLVSFRQRIILIQVTINIIQFSMININYNFVSVAKILFGRKDSSALKIKNKTKKPFIYAYHENLKLI